MRELIKKLHMYSGLLSFSALLVWGVVGVISMLEPAPGKRVRPRPAVRQLSRPLPGDLNDQAAAEWIRREAGLTMVNAPQVRRDGEQNLVAQFFGPNGMTRAVVAEGSSQVRIEQTRDGFYGLLNRAHAMSPARMRLAEWPPRAWAVYNEIGMWSLLFMIASGVVLWLMSRPRWWPALLSLALGGGGFGLLWYLTY